MSKSTGHRQITINGHDLIDFYVMPTIAEEARIHDVPMPNRKQIALVMSALRMHTIIEFAAHYDQSELGKPDQIAEYWPIESSIGRYFRDAGRAVLDEPGR